MFFVQVLSKSAHLIFSAREFSRRSCEGLVKGVDVKTKSEDFCAKVDDFEPKQRTGWAGQRHCSPTLADANFRSRGCAYI